MRKRSPCLAGNLPLTPDFSFRGGFYDAPRIKTLWPAIISLEKLRQTQTASMTPWEKAGGLGLVGLHVRGKASSLRTKKGGVGGNLSGP